MTSKRHRLRSPTRCVLYQDDQSLASDAGENYGGGLDSATQGNARSKSFTVRCRGMVIGKVYSESMFIAYGDGAGRQSTVFNTIFEVLGGYAGKIPAEASLPGRRMPNDLGTARKEVRSASETEEGRAFHLDVKADRLWTRSLVEKKYHDPFSFIPIPLSFIPIICRGWGQ